MRFMQEDNFIGHFLSSNEHVMQFLGTFLIMKSAQYAMTYNDLWCMLGTLQQQLFESIFFRCGGKIAGISKYGPNQMLQNSNLVCALAIFTVECSRKRLLLPLRDLLMFRFSNSTDVNYRNSICDAKFCVMPSVSTPYFVSQLFSMA